MNFFQRLFSRKYSEARATASIRLLGKPVTTPANYEGMSKFGYQKNVTVYKCVQMIGKSCSSIKWDLYQGRSGSKPVEIDDPNHPFNKLWLRPNPLQGSAAFVEDAISYFVLNGNSYLNSVRPTRGGAPTELWTIRPDKMTIEPNRQGYPAKYIFTINGVSKVWEVDFIKMQSDIKHLKTFHPTNDWYGMAPLECALSSLDQANSANTWNLALLQNFATPSGVLQVRNSDNNPTGGLTDEQYERLKSRFAEGHQGARNAAKPLLLEGGLEWKPMAFTPKDMEFIKGKEVSSTDIAIALGVPPEMLGMGQKTYSNYEEARLSFYEETVLPIMDYFRDEMNQWLLPMFGENLFIDYDKDDIEALQSKRDKKMLSISTVNYLTQNEKRLLTGFEPMEGWDVFVIGSQVMESPMAEEETDDTDDGVSSGDDEQENPNEEGQEDDGSEDEEDEAEGEKSFKAVNLLNRNEKKTSWKRQNARRKKLESPFARDLESDFKEMNQNIYKAISSATDPRLAEFAYLKAIEDGMSDIKRTIKRHLKYTMTEFGNIILEGLKSEFKIEKIETKANRIYEDFVESYINKRTAKAITEVEGTTRKKVRETVRQLTQEAIEDGHSNEELASTLRDSLNKLTPARSRLIARTEVAMASNNATLEAVRSISDQVTGLYKEWVSVQDDRTRDGSEPLEANHLDMNGERVGIDEKFHVPPDADMEGPGDESAGAGQVCNCRCVLVYGRSNEFE